MLATLFLVRDPFGDRHVALLASDLVAATAKRLAMFVLRSKVAVRNPFELVPPNSASADRAPYEPSKPRSAQRRPRARSRCTTERAWFIGRTGASS